MSQATIPQPRLMTAEEFLRDYGDGRYRLNQETISLTRNDILTLPDVLPGFALELSKLFQ